MPEISRIRDQIESIDKRVQEHSDTLNEQNEKLDTHIHQLGMLTNIVQHLVEGQKEERGIMRDYRHAVRTQIEASRMESQSLTIGVSNVGAKVETVLARVNEIDVERHKNIGAKEMLKSVLNIGWLVGTSIIAFGGFILGYLFNWFPSGKVK